MTSLTAMAGLAADVTDSAAGAVASHAGLREVAAAGLSLPDTQRRGTTRLVTRALDGGSADDGSFGSSISDDGGEVSFSSDARDLDVDDTDYKTDVYLWDAATRSNERVSIGFDGEELLYGAKASAISGDGGLVVYTSSSPDVVPGDDNSSDDVFAWRTSGGSSTELVSRALDGGSGTGGSSDAEVSRNGRYTTFASFAADLVDDDTHNGQLDIFFADRRSDKIELVTRSNYEGAQLGYSQAPTLSNDGRYITYTSSADDLVPGDTNYQNDIFLFDRKTDKTTLVSTSVTGGPANGGSFGPYLSGNGNFIAYSSSASNLVAETVLPSTSNVYVYNRQTDTTALVTRAFDGSPAMCCSFVEDITADGRYVSVKSYASNLVAGDVNGKQDIFLYDVNTGVVIVVSRGLHGEQSNGPSYNSSVSKSARYISFDSSASNLVADDDNDESDVFVYRR